ncbi:hypothetical protein D3C78_1069220 [compost metagenome]
MGEMPRFQLRRDEVQFDPHVAAVVLQYRVEVVLQQAQRVGEFVQGADQGAAGQGRACHVGEAAAPQLAREQREALVVEAGDGLAQQRRVLVDGDVVLQVLGQSRVDACRTQEAIDIDSALPWGGQQCGHEHGGEDHGRWIRHVGGFCKVFTVPGHWLVLRPP